MTKGSSPELARNRGRLAELGGRPWRMTVGGEPVEGSSTTLTLDPSKGTPLAEVPFADGVDVNAAVEAARAAFAAWAATPMPERAAALRAFGERLVADTDLPILDSGDSGNPIGAMTRDTYIARAIIDHLVGIAPEVKGRTFPSDANSLHMTLREPFGVVARIVPSNRALLFAATKIAAPLVMGNTVVIKAADQTPLPALRIGEIAQEVFPPGVVNVISGDGPTTGDALVRHPAIKRVALTGSVATGQKVQQAAAEAGVKRVSLELGGKNPALVFADADLARTADGLVEGMNFRANQGQSCGSTSRVFVHADVADELAALVDERVRAIRLGDPLDPATDMGCLVSQAQLDKVATAIATGVEQGANLRLGGRTGADIAPEGGWYAEPTIFDAVDDAMDLARDEIFGPVLSMLTWREPDELYERANALDVGLTASIWTRDLDTAVRASRALDVGYVWVNGSSRHFLGVPFGGHRNSGNDYEEGIEELESFTEIKSINVLLDPDGG